MQVQNYDQPTFNQLIPLSVAKTSSYLTDFQSKIGSKIQNPADFQFFFKTLLTQIFSPKPCIRGRNTEKRGQNSQTRPEIPFSGLKSHL